jgi:hypothetical protein
LKYDSIVLSQADEFSINKGNAIFLENQYNELSFLKNKLVVGQILWSVCWLSYFLGIFWALPLLACGSLRVGC